MDIRTLFLVLGAIALTLALAMVYTSTQRKTYDGFHLWTIAFVMNGTAMVLFSLRHVMPDLITVVAANSLFVAHLSLIRRGILRFYEVRAHKVTDILPTAIVALVFPYFTFWRPDVNARIILISAVLAAVYLMIAGVLTSRRLASASYHNPLVTWTCMLSSGFFLIRAVTTALSDWHVTDFMAPGALHEVSVMMYGLSAILIMTGLMAMNSQKLESELKENESRYRLLFSQSPIGIVQIDRDGVIRDFNEAFARIFGAPADALTGFNTLVSIENQDMVMAIREALDGRFGSFDGDYTSVISDKTISLRALTTPIREPSGDIVGAIGIFEDTTEQKRSHEALREKEKLQGVLEMAGAVCHEMNQPLMAILGYVHLLTLDLPKEDLLNEKIIKIAAQAERIRAISNKLMGITRYETKSYLKKTIIDIDRASDLE